MLTIALLTLLVLAFVPIPLGNGQRLRILELNADRRAVTLFVWSRYHHQHPNGNWGVTLYVGQLRWR